MNRIMLDRLAPEPGERVLEVGFGGGDLLELMLKEGADVIGVDPSDAMIAKARRRLKGYGEAGRPQLLTGSADRLPLPAAAVDKACSVNSIYFWRDLPAAMGEFARVVRPGGLLALCFQTPQAVRSWPGHVHGFAAYEVEEVAGFIEAAGFTRPRDTRGSDPKVGEFVCLVSERP